MSWAGTSRRLEWANLYVFQNLRDGCSNWNGTHPNDIRPCSGIGDGGLKRSRIIWIWINHYVASSSIAKKHAVQSERNIMVMSLRVAPQRWGAILSARNVESFLGAAALVIWQRSNPHVVGGGLLRARTRAPSQWRLFLSSCDELVFLSSEVCLIAATLLY